MPGTERRNSSSSEDANAPPSRQLSQDGTEFIPTRLLKVTTPKPAANPLQFIKTGPCDLYKAAQEQIKKVEEIKKVEKVKDDDSEDWQSNLDNWKCSRRKRQEHIIERIVEVKKLELEEHDRNRRRSKTFSEMMEERSSKGGLRKVSMLSYSEEDSNDFSDLGITKNKEKSGGDFSNDQIQNGSNNEREHDDSNGNEGTDLNNPNGHGSTPDYEESSTPATVSSPEPEEYTYERAIRGYMNFAEAKVKTPIKAPAEKEPGGKADFKMTKKEPGGKIGKKLSELEQIRLRSKSTNDLNGGGTDGKQLPKVDILKRRSLFEKAEGGQTESVKGNNGRVSLDPSNAKTIKERLSNLERANENSARAKPPPAPGEMAPHIKETISHLEMQKSGTGDSSGKRLSNGDVSPLVSIKERLNSLERPSEEEGIGKRRISSVGPCPVSMRERLSSLDAASNREATAKLTPERDVGFREKLESFKSTEKYGSEIVNVVSSNGPNRCLEVGLNSLKPADRSETAEEGGKSELDSEGAQISSEKREGFGDGGQSKVGETTSPVKPVSSLRGETTEPNKEVEVVDGQRVDGTNPSGGEAKPKETEGNACQMGKGTNWQGVVEGRDQGDLTKAVRTSSSQTEVAGNPDYLEVSTTDCDTSKTIVTHISLPDDAAMPRPRVNISVSFDSGSRPNSDLEDGKGEGEGEGDKFPGKKSQLGHQSKECKNFNKPTTRVRKLTPMLTAPIISISPLQTVCELQIIKEGENPDRVAEEEKEEEEKQDGGDVEHHHHGFGGANSIEVHMSPGRVQHHDLYQSENELKEVVDTTISEDGKEEDFPYDLQEESTSMYTDENIDEVLGEEADVETLVDDEPQSEVEKIQKELEVFTTNDLTIPLKPETLDKSLPVTGNYENVYLTNQVPQLGMPPESNMYATLSFPLGSRPSVEPPKEKPPPPPLELSDEDSTKPELPPKPSLRRLDSTKRIKKEIRKKRSDFLGIEGSNDDSYLEPEIYVAPPPDMMTFLQEERRLEQQLYRQSICSESDSNHETAESRDSGVELDRGHVDDICWSKPDVLSEPHSRQNSETYGNTSVTSEEDEILKKEREIIEVLEKEEQWRYGNKNSHSPEQNDIGEKLAVKLRQLEQEKMQLERERAEEEDRRKAEESARRQSEQRLIAKQQQLRQQENSSSSPSLFNADSALEQEALRFERERLHKEHEHLERCRQNLMDHQQQNSEPVEIRRGSSHWDTPSNRHSLQEVPPIGVPMVNVPRHSMQDVSQQQQQHQHQPLHQSQMASGYCYSLPDLQQRESRSARPPPPPPPIPPTKAGRPVTRDQWERETNIRNSRIPSADDIPLQIEASTKLRHGSSVPAINIHHGGQQMTRSTLHALSAAPRSRIISNENWMQPKRKADAPKSNYNYQHWLIQEAEHRRIVEHQQKLQSKRTQPAYGGSPPSHHTVGLPISPQSLQGQQPSQKWISPLRADKPLPDAVIQTLTQRVQSRENKTSPRRRVENPGGPLPSKITPSNPETHPSINTSGQSQERMLSVSGKKKCSHCNEELGRGAAMIIESLRLFYHIDCFKCCVCHVQLGDGLMGTDVRVRNNKLHCHNCYSSDDENGDEGQVKAWWPGRIGQGEENLEKVEEEERISLADSKIDSLPEGMNWFDGFLTDFRPEGNRKWLLLDRETALQMIDFEIEKLQHLRDVIRGLDIDELFFCSPSKYLS